MSGGSYEYAFYKILDLASAIRSRAESSTILTAKQKALRMRFADHLDVVADAAHKIEWADSGDIGIKDEKKSIMLALLGEGRYE